MIYEIAAICFAWDRKNYLRTVVHENFANDIKAIPPSIS